MNGLARTRTRNSRARLRCAAHLGQRRVEQLGHAYRGQRLVPGDAQLAPGRQRLAIKGRRLGARAVERGQSGLQAEAPGRGDPAMNARGIELGQILGNERLLAPPTASATAGAIQELVRLRVIKLDQASPRSASLV